MHREEPMIVEYSDGRKFDTSGEYRIVENGGFYLVGEGMFTKVKDLAEGERLIRVLKGEESL
jgi:hypothetical protein